MKMKYLGFALASLAVSAGSAVEAAWKPHRYGPFAAQVVRVIDGDTIKIRAALWPGLEKEINLRLLGVDTPEMRASRSCEVKDARRAKDFVKDFLDSKQVLSVSEVHYGTYAGRVLGNLEGDGQSLKDALLSGGYARPYQSPRNRPPWPCTSSSSRSSSSRSSSTSSRPSYLADPRPSYQV